MTTFHGIGNLQNSSDLLEKLRHDLARMKSNPSDVYAAFDFFVTAEHLADWEYPGRENQEQRKRMRKSDVLLQVTSRIANGSKHFVAEARHHESVQHVDAPPMPDESDLVVTLEGSAASQLGPSIAAVDLAEKVYKFWEHYIGGGALSVKPAN